MPSTKFRLFDLHLNADGLSDSDLATLHYFGTEAALTCAHDVTPIDSSKALLAHFEDLCSNQAKRIALAGIRPAIGIGIHPDRLPWRGLSPALHALPSFLDRPGVVAVGAIGLSEGGRHEEELLLEQLRLARNLRLPALVRTPLRDKLRITKKTLLLLRESRIDPSRVVVDNVTPATFALVLACGFRAGLALRPEPRSIAQAAALVSRYGSEGVHLSTSAGDGPGDLLALPRACALLQNRGVSQAVIHRVVYENTARLLGIPTIVEDSTDADRTPDAIACTGGSKVRTVSASG